MAQQALDQRTLDSIVRLHARAEQGRCENTPVSSRAAMKIRRGIEKVLAGAERRVAL
uniref:hypothetical protein n=1 Tax=Amycolatopsis sp. CA-290885 TaxID=3239925 RepID=UPI003F492613